MFKKYFIYICLLALFACSSPSNDVAPVSQKSPEKTQRLTVVSSGDPAQVLPAFNTFSWDDSYSYVLSASANKNQNEIRAYLQTEIIKYLATKGYVYEADRAKADMVVGFLFALENDVADAKIERKFGLLPHLNSDAIKDVRYEKGSFLLLLLDPDLQKVYWRSAIQGFVNLDGPNGMTDSQRMQWILKLMMGRFPIAGR
ncbi:lipoprotein [Psychromonas sp. CNPT3]|uniref:DUF4136 domain-containing protein n=1 Tax=Psychromonas sp. CNPT3 TaxID=314282 RepID=UPI00006E38F2|nr:DUF4136 domain-containing protein [Psychromonas sp. CNPT3]AGH82234.1 lipoprotein [Psychromonas sp. CNPT3]